MCGIVGYIGDNNVLEKGIKGLKRLEYRGYDSAGLAIYDGKKIHCIKSVGKVIDLEKKIETKNLKNGKSIILHSRWATHGEVTEENSHPHFSDDIFVVHNGTIENYSEIKKKLNKEGYLFRSETDSEVIAHLINYFFKNNLEDAVRMALKKDRLINCVWGFC